MPTKIIASNDKTVSINNPLIIAFSGAKLLFQKAPTAAIALAILSALGAGSYLPSQPLPADENSATVAAATPDAAIIIILAIIIAIIAFIALVIGSIVSGIFAYTSAEIAKGNEVGFKQAVKATFNRLWSFVGLQVLILVKILLWSLLFIIPGIIMAVRYSLANLSFFDSNKKLTGNAAIKDSLALTKNAWLTTFSAQVFLNIITLGLISPIVDTGSKAMLYRQFNALQQTNTPKPKPHALSWVTLGLTILVTVIAIGMLGYAIVNYGLSITK